MPYEIATFIGRAVIKDEPIFSCTIIYRGLRFKWTHNSITITEYKNCFPSGNGKLIHFDVDGILDVNEGEKHLLHKHTYIVSVEDPLKALPFNNIREYILGGE